MEDGHPVNVGDGKCLKIEVCITGGSFLRREVDKKLVILFSNILSHFKYFLNNTFSISIIIYLDMAVFFAPRKDF